MKFPAFAYARPASVAEALAYLADDDEARPIAGGQTLLPILALRMASPSRLVDLGGIEELRAIECTDGRVTVGAMVTHAEIEHSPQIRQQLPLVSEAARYVAHAAVRNRGTLGGSLAHADAAAEWPLITVALEATMRIAGRDGERRVAAADFFTGHYATAIEEGELLTHIEFPVSTLTWTFDEVARRPGDFALVMTAVGLECVDGTCRRACVALGCVADRPLRATAAEAWLAGRVVDRDSATEAARLATSELKSHADIHASAAYRREVSATLVRRALLRSAA